MNAALAIPFESVWDARTDREYVLSRVSPRTPAPDAIRNDTAVPLEGLPSASVTRRTNGAASGSPAFPF